MNHKGTQTITTARLCLRRARPEDAVPMFHNWAKDAEVTKYLTWPPHSNVDVSRMVIESWIREYENKNYYQWMITLKENDSNPIGSISVVHQNTDISKMEIGYCLGKDWWRKGIMTEALMAVMDFLFKEVGVNRIEARHDANNPNSGAVMKKCGMCYEGTLRQADRNNQGVCDSCIYARLAEEYNL